MRRTILITGSSSGIGQASAKHFQQQGWNVVATMRDPHQHGGLSELDNVLVTRLDVQDSASIDEAIAAGISAFGRIDVLLNNAGFGAYGALESTSDDTVLRQFDVNVFGLLRTTRAILPHFRARGGGTVVNISSMGGRFAFPLGALYHGTKFAVEGMSEALQYELREIGVRVKVVEPGMIRTDFAGRSFDFSNTPAIAEYQPLVSRFVSALEPFTAAASPPELVAHCIFEAASDATPRFRYIAGADADALIAARHAQSDASFFSLIDAQFGTVAGANTVAAAEG